MSATAASTARKLAALAAKTPVGPTEASKTPAIAGPMKRASCRERLLTATGLPAQSIDTTADRVRVEAAVLQPVRHTDARRLPQSSAGKDDRNVTPELDDAAWDLVRRDPHRPFEGPRTILPPAHVEHKRPL